MPKAETWTPKKMSLRKTLMQKPKYCYNQLQVSAKWISGVFKRTSPPKKRRKIPEGLSSLTPLLLTQLMGNNHLPLIRSPPPTQKKTKTEIFGVDKNGDKAKTHLQQVSTSLWRRKKETSSKSIAFIVGRRAIMPTSVLRRGNKIQKTSIGLGELYVND